MNTNRGITLIELLVVIGVFGALLTMGMKTHQTGQRMAALSVLAHDRIEAARTLDAALRAIIREGNGVAETAGSYTADADTLILRLAPDAGAERRAVVSRVPETQQPFIAVLRDESGAWTPERFDVFRLPLGGLAFHIEAVLVRCRYSLALEPGERKPEEIPVMTTWAAMRGTGSEVGQ